VSFSGIARNVSSDTNAGKERVENVKGKKGERKDAKNFDKKDRKDKKKEGKEGKRMARKNPYEGLQLTDTQKQQLQQLDANRKAAREQQKMARKENKMRNDSLKMAERRADKKSYLEEVKAIIGPDQYVVFLENFYINGNGGQHKAMKAMKQGHRDGKKDMAHKNHRNDNRAKDQRSRS
ncbi:MAG: hypothetical protein K2H76_02735, partial [Muribaculaceae bacterium]|nr:hypothetical protein [Muribaculaceae bacterium]